MDSGDIRHRREQVKSAIKGIFYCGAVAPVHPGGAPLNASKRKSVGSGWMAAMATKVERPGSGAKSLSLVWGKCRILSDFSEMVDEKIDLKQLTPSCGQCQDNQNKWVPPPYCVHKN